MPYIKSDGKRIVIALGGNALGNTPQEQLELVKHTAACIVDMVAEGNNVIVTHGNGPQVGMINNAFAFASQHDEKTPEMPFPEAGAMSQGYIGYQLSQAILNELRRRGIMRSTANVVTQTVVYPDDPAFQNPTKPVGAFYTEEEAMQIQAEKGYAMKKDANRGYRRVVPSPKPQKIIEIDTIKTLVDGDTVVVAAGGGGIPVCKKDGKYVGIEAVIDKDFASEVLAEQLDADILMILTEVENVCLNFGKPDEKVLHEVTADEMDKYAAEGHFAPGSMLPKVQAVSKFVHSKPGRVAVITSLENAVNGITGVKGTIIKG